VTFLVALAAYPAHDPVADLDPFALLEIVDLRHGSSVLRPLDLEPAGLAILHDLAGLAQGGGSQGEVRAPADPIQLADIDAVVPVLDRDDRPFEGEPFHHVRGDLSRSAGDGAGVPGPAHLAQNQLPAGGVELDRKSTRLNSSHDQISYAVFC